VAAALRASGLIALLLGCSPRVILEEGDGGGTAGTPGTTVEPGTTTTTTTTSSTTTVTTDAPESSDGPSVVFDHPACASGWCDPWLQDCPRGSQCNPTNMCGVGDTWASTRCFPLDRYPAKIGEACTTEDSPYSGDETCGLDGFCWNVHPTTYIGTCAALCTGSPADPFCADPNTACLIANDGALPLCLPSCDPLLQDCEDGEGCHPVTTMGEFVCMPFGAPIETDRHPTWCSAGSTDVDPALLASACTVDQPPCCATYCDLGMPLCDPGLVCTPYYDQGGFPPPLGLCLDPA
jgi:hypothetical protein